MIIMIVILIMIRKVLILYLRSYVRFITVKILKFITGKSYLIVICPYTMTMSNIKV